MYPWATSLPKDYLISLPPSWADPRTVCSSSLGFWSLHMDLLSKGCACWVNTRMVGLQTHWKRGLSHVLKTWKMYPKGSTMCTSFCCSLAKTHGNAVVPPPKQVLSNLIGHYQLPAASFSSQGNPPVTHRAFPESLWKAFLTVFVIPEAFKRISSKP